jgi:ATP-dependent DNA ligase
VHFLDLRSSNKPREPQPITNQIQKRTEPAFIEPMQCKSVTALPAGEKWSFEIKLDGYRCITVKRALESPYSRATIRSSIGASLA